MFSYEANNLSKFTHSNEIDTMINQFRDRKSTPKSVSKITLNKTPSYSQATTYEDTKSSNPGSMFLDSFNFNTQRKSFNDSIADRAKHYTIEFKKENVNRLNKRNKAISQQVDVLEPKYRNINSNNYVMSEYHHFKNICQYNKKARNFYSKDYSEQPGCWSIGTTNKVYCLRKAFDPLINK